MASIILTAGDYRLIPPGHYRLRIEKIEEISPSSPGKDPFLSWTCEIVEDLDNVGVVGDKYYFNTPKTIRPSAKSKWWQFLTKVNPSLDDIDRSTLQQQDLKFDLTKPVDEGGLIGCEFYAECIIRKKQGVAGEKNDFKEGGVRSLEEFKKYVRNASRLKNRMRITGSEVPPSTKGKPSPDLTEEEIEDIEYEILQEEYQRMQDDIEE